MSTAVAEQPRLKRRYASEIQGQLKDQLGLANVMQVPRLEKIVVNMGVGRATQQPSLLEGAVKDLTIITGQKPLVTKAGQSIAGFKLREGQSIGAKVTLRGDRMWEFLDRLISVAIPRIRDFRGLPAKSFDGRGNYTFGVNEQLIFPEIDYDKVDVTRGMDITIVTSAVDDDGGRALLEAFGWPFKRGEDDTVAAEPRSAVRPEAARALPRAPRRSDPRSDGERLRWPRRHSSRSSSASPSTRCGPTRGVGAVAGRARCTATSASAASACVSWHWPGSCPVSPRRAGKERMTCR